MSEELKPCLCGSPAKHEISSAYGRSCGRDRQAVICTNQLCAIECVGDYNIDIVGRWNNRPREAELLATIAELREVLLRVKRYVSRISDIGKIQQALDNTKDIK